MGGREAIDVETRIVAATNADLKKGMEDGSFREDFYFRLSVVEMRLPPLRERGQDIEFLANSFLNRYALENGKRKLKFNKAAMEGILAYPWSGNVRELQNRVRRSAIMADGDTVTTEDLQLPSKTLSTIKGASLREARENLEKEMVQTALAKHKGKITAAASELGISRPTFYELLDKLDIRRD